jgi:hypothetical protein
MKGLWEGVGGGMCRVLIFSEEEHIANTHRMLMLVPIMGHPEPPKDQLEQFLWDGFCGAIHF